MKNMILSFPTKEQGNGNSMKDMMMSSLRRSDRRTGES
jgi:hypothetical protein